MRIRIVIEKDLLGHYDAAAVLADVRTLVYGETVSVKGQRFELPWDFIVTNVRVEK